MLRFGGRRRGFTAVEVLAVTTILTSLGSGSFIGVTERAHRVACEQHLRQIGMALQMRALTDEPLPRAWFYPPDPPHPARETYNLVRLMANEVPASMFICPSAPAAIQRRGICYVYNDVCGGKTLDEIPNPSMTWLLMDINVVSSRVPPAHNGGCNVLFADGHVKWYPASQLPKFELPDQSQEQ